MNKRNFILCLAISCLLVYLTGCANDTKINGYDKYSDNSFNGIIIEINDDTILIEPDDNDEYLNSYSRILINMINNDSQTYEIGDKVRVTYRGGINDINPAQLEAIKIELIN